MLKLEGNALKLFFDGQTLYRIKQKQENKAVFDYEGENNKYILMLFHHEAKGAVPAASKPFLEKILSSVKLGFKDVALMNVANIEIPPYQELKSFFAPSAIFLWGVKPAVLGIDAGMYQLVMHGLVKVVCVDCITDVEKNDEMKKKLWGVLKTHFLQ